MRVNLRNGCTMKIKILICSIFIFSFVSVYSRDSLKFNHIIDVSYSLYDFNYMQTKENFKFVQFKSDMHVFNIQYNYKILEFLSIGGYGRIGRYQEEINEQIYDDSTQINTFNSLFYGSKNCWHYGLSSKIFLVPLFFKSNIPRFDLYMAGNFGLVSDFKNNYQNVFTKNDHFIDLSAKIGFSLYLFKKVGVFIEYGYSHNKYYSMYNWHYGVNYRF